MIGSKSSRIFSKLTLFLLLVTLVALSFGKFDSNSKKFLFQDEPFDQPVAQRFSYKNIQLADWKELPFSNITQLAKGKEESDFIWILCEDSVYFFYFSTQAFVRVDQTLLKINIQPNSKISVSPNGNFVSICDASGIFRCSLQNGNYSCERLKFSFGPISSLLALNSQNVWIGTSNTGLYYLNSNQPIRQTTVYETQILSLGTDRNERIIYAGTFDRLWKFDIETSRWRYNWVGSLDGNYPGDFDGPITTITADEENKIWLGNDLCVNLIHLNGTFQRFGGVDGLPFANITSLSSTRGEVWMGTKMGIVRYSPRNSRKWFYYYGMRFHPGTSVQSLVVTVNQREIIGIAATDLGMTFISIKRITLQRKAKHLQSLVYPRLDRHGLVASCGLKQLGNLSTWFSQAGESDGLWTGIYLAGQCFRYAVTKEKAVKDRAWKSFEAMEFLHNVTGISGYVARTFAMKNESHGKTWWYDSPTYPGWVWQGNTSSDSLSGHYFVYPLVYDLLAETPDEKARASRLMRLVASHIVDNGFKYIGYDGVPSLWGRWDPPWINDRWDRADERGLNSLQILSWLYTSYLYTKNESYVKAFSYLADNNGYGENIVNQKITTPSDDNYSDNELAFLPYLDWIWSKNPFYREHFNLSLTRAFYNARHYHSSLWNFIYALYMGTNSDFDLEGAIETLRTWPIEMIDWPVSIKHRLDILIDPDLDRSGTYQILELLPYDEISFFRWNANPYEYADQGSGYNEYDPGAYLTPYWLGRYLGIISPNYKSN